ncbi:MAG: hypothetical protein HYT87_14770 [Nitrospirae bacterium]|nr:hypothetical protein [Nitrospirota bacterium]
MATKRCPKTEGGKGLGKFSITGIPCLQPILGIVSLMVAGCGGGLPDVVVPLRPERAGMLSRVEWNVVDSEGERAEVDIVRLEDPKSENRAPSASLQGRRDEESWDPRVEERSGLVLGDALNRKGTYLVMQAAGVPVAIVAGHPPVIEWLDPDHDRVDSLTELLLQTDPTQVDVTAGSDAVRRVERESYAFASDLPVKERGKKEKWVYGREGRILFESGESARADLARWWKGPGKDNTCAEAAPGDAWEMHEVGCDVGSLNMSDGWHTVWAEDVLTFRIGRPVPATVVKTREDGMDFLCQGDEKLFGPSLCYEQCSVGAIGFRSCGSVDYVSTGPGIAAVRVRSVEAGGAIDLTGATVPYRSVARAVGRQGREEIRLSPGRGDLLKYCADGKGGCEPTKPHTEILRLSCKASGCKYFVNTVQERRERLSAPRQQSLVVIDGDAPTAQYTPETGWLGSSGTYEVKGHDASSPLIGLYYCAAGAGAPPCEGDPADYDRLIAAEGTGGQTVQDGYGFTFTFTGALLQELATQSCAGLGACTMRLAGVVMDSAGNPSVKIEAVVKRDVSVPIVTAYAPEYTTEAAATVKFSMTDTGSGPAKVRHCMAAQGSDTCEPATETNVDETGSAEVTVDSRSSVDVVTVVYEGLDQLGNVSTRGSVVLKFDGSGPMVQMPSPGVYGPGPKAVSATDASGAGLDRVVVCVVTVDMNACPEKGYAVQPSSGVDPLEFTVDVTCQEGDLCARWILAKAFDRAGNAGAWAKTKLSIDQRAPAITIEGPAGQLLASKAEFKITSADGTGESGVAKVTFCTGANGACDAASGQNVPAGGRVTLEGDKDVFSWRWLCVRSSDRIGNAASRCVRAGFDHVTGACAIENGGGRWMRWTSDVPLSSCVEPGQDEFLGDSGKDLVREPFGARVAYCITNEGGTCVPNGSKTVAVDAASRRAAMPIGEFGCGAGEGCAKAVFFRMEDKFGNVGKVESGAVRIDLQAPELMALLSGTTLTVNVSDGHSGAALVRYHAWVSGGFRPEANTEWDFYVPSEGGGGAGAAQMYEAGNWLNLSGVGTVTVNSHAILCGRVDRSAGSTDCTVTIEYKVRDAAGNESTGGTGSTGSKVKVGQISDGGVKDEGAPVIVGGKVYEGLYESSPPLRSTDDGMKNHSVLASAEHDIEVWAGGGLPVSVRFKDGLVNAKNEPTGTSAVDYVRFDLFWGFDGSQACSESYRVKWECSGNWTCVMPKDPKPATELLGIAYMRPLSGGERAWTGSLNIDLAKIMGTDQYRGDQVDPAVNSAAQAKQAPGRVPRRWFVRAKAVDVYGNVSACAASNGFYPYEVRGEGGDAHLKFLQMSANLGSAENVLFGRFKSFGDAYRSKSESVIALKDWTPPAELGWNSGSIATTRRTVRALAANEDKDARYWVSSVTYNQDTTNGLYLTLQHSLWLDKIRKSDGGRRTCFVGKAPWMIVPKNAAVPDPHGWSAVLPSGKVLVSGVFYNADSTYSDGYHAAAVRGVLDPAMMEKQPAPTEEDPQRMVDSPRCGSSIDEVLRRAEKARNPSCTGACEPSFYTFIYFVQSSDRGPLWPSYSEGASSYEGPQGDGYERTVLTAPSPYGDGHVFYGALIYSDYLESSGYVPRIVLDWEGRAEKAYGEGQFSDGNVLELAGMKCRDAALAADPDFGLIVRSPYGLTNYPWFRPVSARVFSSASCGIHLFCAKPEGGGQHIWTMDPLVKEQPGTPYKAVAANKGAVWKREDYAFRDVTMDQMCNLHVLDDGSGSAYQPSNLRYRVDPARWW